MLSRRRSPPEMPRRSVPPMRVSAQSSRPSCDRISNTRFLECTGRSAENEHKRSLGALFRGLRHPLGQLEVRRESECLLDRARAREDVVLVDVADLDLAVRFANGEDELDGAG